MDDGAKSAFMFLTLSISALSILTAQPSPSNFQPGRIELLESEWSQWIDSSTVQSEGLPLEDELQRWNLRTIAELERRDLPNYLIIGYRSPSFNESHPKTSEDYQITPFEWRELLGKLPKDSQRRRSLESAMISLEYIGHRVSFESVPADFTPSFEPMTVSVESSNVELSPTLIRMRNGSAFKSAIQKIEPLDSHTTQPSQFIYLFIPRLVFQSDSIPQSVPGLLEQMKTGTLRLIWARTNDETSNKILATKALIIRIKKSDLHLSQISANSCQKGVFRPSAFDDDVTIQNYQFLCTTSHGLNLENLETIQTAIDLEKK